MPYAHADNSLFIRLWSLNSGRRWHLSKFTISVVTNLKGLAICRNWLPQSIVHRSSMPLVQCPRQSCTGSPGSGLIPPKNGTPSGNREGKEAASSRLNWKTGGSLVTRYQDQHITLCQGHATDGSYKGTDQFIHTEEKCGTFRDDLISFKKSMVTGIQGTFSSIVDKYNINWQWYNITNTLQIQENYLISCIHLHNMNINGWLLVMRAGSVTSTRRLWYGYASCQIDSKDGMEIVRWKSV
jgi:hypothetical protein